MTSRMTAIILFLLTTPLLAQRKNSAQSDVKASFSERYLNAPEAYAIRKININFEGMDFSPVAYRNGLVFVSSRARRETRSEFESDFLNLFYTEEFENGTFSPPEPLDQRTLSAYHEGPAVFLDSGRQRIFTRNTFVKKSKARDGSVNPLELAHAVQLTSGKWSEPIRLPLADEGFSVAHPAISLDGKRLFFSSDMPGTLGASDLFVSEFSDGNWTAPRNLGAAVNTSGQELFPFLHNDSILFFASNGREGLGGLDLFYYNLNAPGAGVTHLGAPLNSEGDDFGLWLEADGNAGFLSSDRAGGQGADDIYYFEEIQPFVNVYVYDSLSGDPVGNGIVTLQSDDRGVRAAQSDPAGKAEFRISTLRDYRLHVSAEGYKDSEMRLNPAYWPPGQRAEVKVYLNPLRTERSKEPGYSFATRARRNLSNVITFSSSPLDVDIAAEIPPEPAVAVAHEEPDSASVDFLKVIVVEIVNSIPAIILSRNDSIYELKGIAEATLANEDVGLTIHIPRGAKRHDYEEVIREQVLAQGYGISNFLLIRSFFFDSNKTWVRNDACAQLDKIIDVMYAHPHFELEMIFHSDSRGTEAFNLDLSKARAQEVTTYLVKGGVDPKRIHSSFVGEGRLLNDCGELSDCDELLHQINRTAEFKFIIR